jgi:hypothetical protein
VAELERQKRQFPRYGIEPLPCSLCISAHTACHLINVSLGGMFLRMRHPLPVGSRVVVKFTLGPLAGLRLPAQVRWIREAGPYAGMGLALFEPHPRLLKVIHPSA